MDTQTMQQPRKKARRSRHARKHRRPLKQLAFHLRVGKRGAFGARRGTTLLITNCCGVLSLRRRRYVKKTRFHRFHRLKKKAAAVEKLHATLLRLGMRSWPVYDERVALLRGRLADAYWAAAPAPYRERAVAFLRVARWHRLGRRLLFYAYTPMIIALPLYVLSRWAVIPARITIPYMALSVCLIYMCFTHLWRFAFHEPDDIVRMLKKVA